MFLFVIIGIALVVAALPILRVSSRVRANIRAFNRRCLPAIGEVVDFDTVEGRRFPILSYTPEGRGPVRVAGTGAADRDLELGDRVDMHYDPDALGDVSFTGKRDEAGLVGPLTTIGYVLVALGTAVTAYGLSG